MLRFVVHEHHATHLHFDLRLEMEGVLKSFALPKGPSMNPADKRLAIMVADHALGYADFEGVIPEGEYGAGRVVIWDCGTVRYVKGSLPEGMLELELAGRTLNGRFLLKRLAGEDRNWLFFKKNDSFADRRFRLKMKMGSEETGGRCD